MHPNRRTHYRAGRSFVRLPYSGYREFYDEAAALEAVGLPE